MGKFWAYRLRNNRKRTRKDAKPGPGFVTRRNGIGFTARERRELENRWAQALGGSSPSPSVPQTASGVCCARDRAGYPLARWGAVRYHDIMEVAMAQLVVRNLDQDVKTKLQQRARRHGRSTEEEVRDILRNAVSTGGAPRPALGTRLKARFARLGLTE